MSRAGSSSALTTERHSPPSFPSSGPEKLEIESTSSIGVSGVSDEDVEGTEELVEGSRVIPGGEHGMDVTEGVCEGRSEGVFDGAEENEKMR